MLERIITKSKNLIRVVKNPLLIGTFVIGSTILSCNRSQDYSTPESSFGSYLESYREGDHDQILKNYGLKKEEIEKIRRIQGRDQFKEILMEGEEELEKYSFEVVDTKYCIINNEEAALLRVIMTDKQTGKKEEICCRLANNFGSWVMIDTYKPPLPPGVEPYNKSTIKDNTHESKVVKEIRERTLKEIKIRYEEEQGNDTYNPSIKNLRNNLENKFDLSTPKKTLELFLDGINNKKFNYNEIKKLLTGVELEDIDFKTEENYKKAMEESDEKVLDHKILNEYILSDKVHVILSQGDLVSGKRKKDDEYLLGVFVNENGGWKIFSLEGKESEQLAKMMFPIKSFNDGLEFIVRASTYEGFKRFYGDKLYEIWSKGDAIKSLKRCEDILIFECQSLRKDWGYDEMEKLDKKVEEFYNAIDRIRDYIQKLEK